MIVIHFIFKITVILYRFGILKIYKLDAEGFSLRKKMSL